MDKIHVNCLLRGAVRLSCSARALDVSRDQAQSISVCVFRRIFRSRASKQVHHALSHVFITVSGNIHRFFQRDAFARVAALIAYAGQPQ